MLQVELFTAFLYFLGAKSLQSYPTLGDPQDMALSSSVRGTLGQEHWSGVVLFASGDLPTPGSDPASLPSSFMVNLFTSAM